MKKYNYKKQGAIWMSIISTIFIAELILLLTAI